MTIKRHNWENQEETLKDIEGQRRKLLVLTRCLTNTCVYRGNNFQLEVSSCIALLSSGLTHELKRKAL
jgi:hypothetical protein